MSRQGAVVCGYYGFANAGDEAVLAGLVHGLRRAGYSEHLTVLSANPAYTEREHGVQAILRTSLQVIWRAMRRARLFVLGGGSLLQDVTSARSVVYYLGMHVLARRAGCRIAWIGQGIGPLRRGWARRWVARTAEGAETIVVRDPASADLLRTMGVSRVQVGADLSFLLPEADIEYGWQVLQGAGVCRDDALIALAPRRWAGAGADVDALLADLMQYARQEWGARALLLAMQPSRDDEIVRKIAAEVPEAIVPAQPLSVRDIQSVLACCQVVIGVRLHALMLAAASGIPALALSYDPKVRAFWEQVAPEYVVEPQAMSAQTLRERLNSIWEERQALRKRVGEFAEGQRHLAERNISALFALVR
ncbi:MAG: polysaccharide pyruvyl transferase CsaB [Chthonomonadetes bacterium]|nr:polysaccharide pyruvyl transferase CsaB [Chthonomonadetes bacterium]